MKTRPTRSSATTRRRARRARARSHAAPRRRASLDDLMRALWQRYGQTGIGVPEDGVEALASELAGARPVRLLRALRRRHRGSPARASCSREFGVTHHLRPGEGRTDRGGKPGRNDDDEPRLDGSGRARRERPERCSTSSATALPSARARGRRHARRDRRAAAVAPSASQRCLPRGAPGETLAVHAFRRDELMHVRFDARCRTGRYVLAVRSTRAVAEARRRAVWPGCAGRLARASPPD